jgi:predicted ATPase
LQQSLREILDGFDSLDLRRAGRTARVLRAVFTKPPDGEVRSSKKQPLEFDFDELSDGQKILIALYTILHCVVAPDATVCIDEPENFIALD